MFNWTYIVSFFKISNLEPFRNFIFSYTEGDLSEHNKVPPLMPDVKKGHTCF